MGDTIDSTVIVKPLLELYGQNLEIEWVTKPNLELLFKYDFRITPIILRFTNLPLLINIGKLKIILKSFFKPYDAVINLELGKKFINLARFTRSRIKIGLPHKHIPENIKKYENIVLKDFNEVIKNSDLVFILVAHSEFEEIKFDNKKIFNFSES